MQDALGAVHTLHIYIYTICAASSNKRQEQSPHSADDAFIFCVIYYNIILFAVADKNKAKCWKFLLFIIFL
jgi:hypothetical protein